MLSATVLPSERSVKYAADMSTVDWRNFNDEPLPPLLMSSLRCFVQRGYNGTTTRELAAAAGLSVPGLYHHYPSKQAILAAITTASLEDLMARSLAALAEAGDDPARQLELHIECMVLFHAYYRDLAFIAGSEIRALESTNRAAYIDHRDEQERILRGIVQRGQASGSFDIADAAGTARALATVCTGVSQWFNPAGARSASAIARDYVEIARRVVGEVRDR